MNPLAIIAILLPLFAHIVLGIAIILDNLEINPRALNKKEDC